jgi:hypothetical protein
LENHDPDDRLKIIGEESLPWFQITVNSAVPVVGSHTGSDPVNEVHRAREGKNRSRRGACPFLIGVPSAMEGKRMVLSGSNSN